VVILDDHSADLSRETTSWLAAQPTGFTFTSAPMHASWLDLVEGFFFIAIHSSTLGTAKSTLRDRNKYVISETTY
jgi:hypothetical protein